jgi:hypothetical protein
MAKKDIFSELIKAEAKKMPSSFSAFDKKSILILPELKAYIPPLTGEETLLLEQSLLSEGCREALILWKQGVDYVLVDGHNRYALCQKHGLDFKVEVKEFADIEEVKGWMINNQLGKRNVTEEVKSYLRGLQYKNAKNKLGGTGANQHKQQLGQNDQAATHEKLAAQHKVSSKTIQRDEKFYEGLELLTEGDKELKWKILNRELNVPKTLIGNLSKQNKEEVKELLTKINQGTHLSKTPSIKPKKKAEPDLNMMLKALENSGSKVIIEIKGDFLIENNLAAYWQELRQLEKPITADFTDYITWGQAKAIGLVK